MVRGAVSPGPGIVAAVAASIVIVSRLVGIPAPFIVDVVTFAGRAGNRER